MLKPFHLHYFVILHHFLIKTNGKRQMLQERNFGFRIYVTVKSPEKKATHN